MYICIHVHIKHIDIHRYTYTYFSSLQKWEYQYNKINNKTVVIKARETRVTIINYNLDKSN